MYAVGIFHSIPETLLVFAVPLHQMSCTTRITYSGEATATLSDRHLQFLAAAAVPCVCV